MSIKIRLGDTLDAASVTKNALAREAKVRPNLIYDLCEGKTKRLDLDTLNNIVNTLRALTGNDYTLNDVLEYIPDDHKG
ncbi:helix-turn-helix transcriptional regulator [Paenibacillus sp. FSL H8-0317]|uniref:helix-turn-helix domain-containing protein n=1 Tax=Paenibacillus TaxID=44249 RepID=UPI00096EA7D3|nr:MULTISPECIES: helix-turn-helix transcriptional regulator [Paenibacillus]OMF40466.1 XRE family transcriptional regulator [Paenibacillus amylolyticus]PKQ92360.1 XRE family transcriptional regulator [Paenibacillus sp. BGI2013]